MGRLLSRVNKFEFIGPVGAEGIVAWLLVEDDNDIRNVVAVMMSVWGEKPLPFPDGTAAWAWLDTVANGTFTGELPDLALMDIRMPGYTGDKVAARIRQLPALKDIPIILMTAFSLTDSEIKDMMDQSGIDHLINKPLPDMAIFRTTLYRVRDERRTRAAKQAATATGTAPAIAAASPTPAATQPASAAPASAAMPTTPPVKPSTPAAPPATAAPPAAPMPATVPTPSSTPSPVQPGLGAPAGPSIPVNTPDKPLTPPAPEKK